MLQDQGLELFLKDQEGRSLGQGAVFATHLALQLIVAALQFTHGGVGRALLGGTDRSGLGGGAKDLAPLDELVLKQPSLTTPGVQRRSL